MLSKIGGGGVCRTLLGRDDGLSEPAPTELKIYSPLNQREEPQMKINMTKSGAGQNRKVRAAWIVLPAFLLFGGSAVYGAPQEQQQGVQVGRDANGQLTYKVTV